MENAIVVKHDDGVINFETYAMPVDNLIGQIRLIQNVMANVMRESEHFGVIPGTRGKPSLLKPGAEKLSLTFRLAPEYEIIKSDMPNNHREYEIKCRLIHIPTGQFVGEGVGSASTMEAKYRYRVGEVEFTGKPVPGEYWNERDIKLIGGKGFAAKKNPDTGKWEIARQGEKVEHDNPADYYNTVLKMAKKRAHVDAILTATAASDIFTQDVEDLPAEILNEKTNGRPKPPDADNAPPQTRTDAAPPAQRARRGQNAHETGQAISEPQPDERKLNQRTLNLMEIGSHFKAKAHSLGLNTDDSFDLSAYIRQSIGLCLGRAISSKDELTDEDIDNVILAIKGEE